MTMQNDKLIRMANQMADFFRSQPGSDAAKGVAAHINDYWTYQMRRDFLDLLSRGAEGADPLVVQAGAYIDIPDSGAPGAARDEGAARGDGADS
ncbi:formate dehydrogenase subunit delta [Paracoccus pacificus]|uniref:Formate dehydrogenase subunit delta n=1 Tax=Paracoccus pacificus TaxID=1463598 RepID=A0ABW4R8Q2_9RHOB